MASVSKRRWTYKGKIKETWMVRYTDPRGVRRGKSFDLKRDAEKYRLKVETEIEAGDHVAAGASITVAVLFNQY